MPRQRRTMTTGDIEERIREVDRVLRDCEKLRIDPLNTLQKAVNERRSEKQAQGGKAR